MIEQPIGTPLSRDLVPGEDLVEREWEKDEFLSSRDKRAKLRHQEEADRRTEMSWKADERRAQARRAAENHASWLDHEKRLRSVYLELYLEKDRIIKQLEVNG